MPALDGTGPMGKGPITGRGMGRCVYYGFGRGQDMRYRQLQSIEDNQSDLNFIKEQLEAELSEIKERISKIEHQTK